MAEQQVGINSDFITLGQFLKWASIADSGLEAKFLVAEGKISVNAEIEKRRGRKLVPGDRVTVAGQTYQITLNNH
ncbi:ribosome-associated protein [Hydrogenispora ethanolica]|uniref:Ribosome-associated protein n=1 Tax=Hydrogenispora ethanolica TaxID=1082276 RepID=A0A4R1SAT1_HYDET|nr:RNA-binding S4 domain-containing protein [Hydrogenispora ethanolica]TCL76334.1 ribosome-associated protein [Hydrogenispora ethanolica]